ncbi:MAG: DUF192 domain-containing protein [Alphaproteobacteria bacterium]|nr:DUF192 domain-containing protein [Alphaproteobacteria bacterium]
MRRRLVLPLLAAAVLSARHAAAQVGQRAVDFPRSSLVIESSGRTHRFTVEVADNDQRRALGLMHRDSMPADHGMVFDFKLDQPVAMWMRNTRIPLDMLFIDRDGRVVNIHARAVPFDETSIHSDGPVRGVLELNGGTASRLGLKAGDTVRHAIFRNAVP